MLNLLIIELCIPLLTILLFEIVYGFIPLTPLELLPLPLDASLIHKDGDGKARFVKKLHEKVKLQIEKKVQHYARLANKGKKEMVFELGD